MAEWTARWTPNPEVLGLNPALTTTWIWFMVAPSSNPHKLVIHLSVAVVIALVAGEMYTAMQ